MEKWNVTSRQRCDLEMLLNGAFKPLSHFNSQHDYESILATSRLANGKLWPIPITLDVSADFAAKISFQDVIALCDHDNTLLARMFITDKWQADKIREAQAIFGTSDQAHPGVEYLLNKAGTWYLGGTLECVQLPNHYDYTELRRTPKMVREYFQQRNWHTIIAFQTRNPMHRAHMELTLRAAREFGGNILIHPVVGMTKPRDVDYFTRVRCYQKILHYYPTEKVALSLLPLAMRMAGPKEALWHALIRKNYGCTHFIVGRDHAGPGKDSQGNYFYDPFSAQQLLARHQEEIGITMLPFQEMVYCKERKQYCVREELKPAETALTISGTELRQALLREFPIPDWFSFPEIIQELRNSSIPKHKKGFTLFFTGLSSAGKTTLAQAVMAQLLSLGKKNVTLLDGDAARRILSTELGFSKADRDLNILRIGFVAAELTKVGGIVLCAAIAPYLESREKNRQIITQYGGYVEVHVSTSLAICESRDRKGIYAKARAGALKGVTGIDDPYESPENPEITVDTSSLTIAEAAGIIIEYLYRQEYLRKVGTENPENYSVPYERVV